MITVLIQTGMCLFAGLALWVMWRSLDGDDRAVRTIVFVGFTARALTGTILFWISWLGLPIFSSLQVGNGLWFYALDGELYLREAISIAQGGLPSIIMHTRTGPSVGYVQTLATSTVLFGRAASVAVLVNLFSYMGMCLIILKWRNVIPAARIPGLIALAAISLSPSALLWSTQPLKDTLFQFLIVCMIAAGAVWQRAWDGRPATGAIVASALVMSAALFMASGIRWYFGFVALIASGAFMLLTAVTAEHRWRAVLAGAVTFFLLSQSLVISASDYLPPYLRNILVPWKPSAPNVATLSPEHLAQELKSVRSGFENTGGATSIGVAGTLARVDPGRRFVPPTDRSESSGKKGEEVVMPTSTAGRLLAGAVAMVLPSSVARKLGLLKMGDGRGFWWFTDVDSIVFDAVLVIALVFIVRRVRWATLGNPIFWFVVLVASVGVPIAYTVTNYGTLFRLRAMVFVALALIPLALSMATAKHGEDRQPHEGA